jgi:transcriptional regulator GlxA family with amidase domain
MEHDAFRRWFRRHTGSAPAAYRDAARIAAAQTLLAGTDLDITAIASRTGFSDRFGFSKRFRTATGEPPAAFRARRR